MPAATIPNLLQSRLEQTPTAIACAERDARGHWVSYSWREHVGNIVSLARGLQEAGLKPGERVAIAAPPTRFWQLCRMAVVCNGSCVVGCETHAPPERRNELLRIARPTILCASDVQCVLELPPDIVQQIRLFVFPTAPVEEVAGPWIAVDQLSATDATPTSIAAVHDEDIAAIIFTSGTSGSAKAIAYTHRQLLAAVTAIQQRFGDLGPEDRMLCWLPMAHLFQQMMNLVAVARGVALYFLDDPRQVIEEARRVRPTIFLGVPRFYEKLREGIEERIQMASRWQRGLAHWAQSVAARAGTGRRRQQRRPVGLLWRCAEFLVLRRLRSALGGQVRLLICGSAPLDRTLLEWFEDTGWPILEAYGVSENTIPMAANHPQQRRIGSVGIPFPENEIRLADDGEVLVRGPGVFTGYLGERSESPFDADGFYRTGDLGRLDEDGFLFLSGRKSEWIKTSTGRRISPSHVERVYAQCPLVERVLVFGNNYSRLIGFVWLKPLPQTPLAHAAKDWRATIQTLSELFQELEQQLPAYERLANFAVVEQPLTMQQGHLTTTLKIRRRPLEQHLQPMIERLHQSSQPIRLESVDRVLETAS